MEAACTAIDQALASSSTSSDSLVQALDHNLIWNKLASIGEKRALSSHLLKRLVSNSNNVDFSNNTALLECLLTALSHYSPSSNSSYDKEADDVMRELLFDALVEAGELVQAATVLGNRRFIAADHMASNDELIAGYTVNECCDLYVKVAECFLAEDCVVEAEGALQKASMFVDHGVDRAGVLFLRYSSVSAKVLDSNRNFLQAALKYYELSTNKTVDEAERLVLLGNAATCAILSKRGAQRSRCLKHIYNDERLSQLDTLTEFSAHCGIVTKMFKNQLLRCKEELETFKKTLVEHQRAEMGDGLTIFERAVIEQNIEAVSKLYINIYFTQLGPLLGVDARRAEDITAKMIAEGQLTGSIDEVDGLLHFEDEASSSVASAIHWDGSIAKFCEDLDAVAQSIKAL